jgi:hypothetical protein
MLIGPLISEILEEEIIPGMFLNNMIMIVLSSLKFITTRRLHHTVFSSINAHIK